MNNLIILFVTISFSFADSLYQTNQYNIALSGLGVVSYYRYKYPVLGRDSLSFDYDGVIWLFANDENRDRFRVSPETYLPQYGGYCSWGMRFNGRYEADHTVFMIHESKLYFNQDKRVERWWKRRRENNIKRADENWAELRK